MTPEDSDAAADRLAAKYPSVPRAVVIALLAEAEMTVRRMNGDTDPQAAEDLVQLRLDVRTRGH